jgi:peptidoglycan/xylan/chitin deacetylase (PgdA/CDA1 family)
VVLAVLAALMAPAAAVAAQAPRTIVTIGFDDGSADQYQALAPLAAHGMRATFFVNSGQIETSAYYLTWGQVRDLAAAGHEIGGHGTEHRDLSLIPVAEAARQVCEDRAALVSRGFTPTSFAYPYGHSTPAVQRIVRECGYDSARSVSGIFTPGGCMSCDVAERIPPPDPFHTLATPSVEPTTTLAEMKARVTRAERRGGRWVQLIFHQICAGCGTYAVTPEDLAAFLGWLAPRSARGTVVMTTAEALRRGAPRCDGVRATIAGTPGDDVIRGTPRRDVIVADGGDDVVHGRGGDDLICLGPGDDRAAGGGGDDRILGEAGRDRLLGGRGDDVLTGGAGVDVLLGGPGRDRAVGGAGRDTCVARVAVGC